MSEEEKYQQEQPQQQPQPVLTQQKSLPTEIKSPLSASRIAIKKIYFPPNEKIEEINEKKENNEKTQEIEITMKFDIIMMKDGLSKHQIFNVKGEDKFGSFEMFRNYNDFLEIRKVLVQRWPGCYVPPLPKKKIVGDMNKENLRERTAFFEDFYKKISQIKFLYYSKEYQLFLRGNKNNADLEKTLKTLPAENYEDILRKYSVCFADLAGVLYYII